MAKYSVEERLDMYNLYIQNYRNSFIASERYAELYPERRQPHRKTFQKLSNHLSEFGTLQNIINHRVIETANEVNVLAQINLNPESGQRKVAEECNLSKSGVQKILAKHGFHDYKFQPVQNLHPGDELRRLEFCQWLCNEIGNDPNFSASVLWSDESLFTNSGIFNRRNSHFYATNNPLMVRELRPQNRFSFNI